jgi:hypothetical protein
MPVHTTPCASRNNASDGLQGNQREGHDSCRDVSVDELSKLGVLYYRFPEVEEVDKFALEREYEESRCDYYLAREDGRYL